MVLAQASLYRRAGMARGVIEHMLTGVKRVYQRSRHMVRLPSNSELKEYLSEQEEKMSARELHLSTFLATGTYPRLDDGRELVRLAQSCDSLRRRLERQR
jgi:hypothetical protein